MENYSLEQTPKTPLMDFNASEGHFQLKGKSIPENAKVFYAPLFAWIDEYIQNPLAQTTFDVQLDYFNTSSAKIIIDLFRKLELIEKNNKGKIVFNWHYNEDDGDMLEAGQDYQSMVKSTFNLISFNN